MEITVDVIKCAKYGVTPNEYIVLKLLEKNSLKEVEDYIDYKSCINTLKELYCLEENNTITHLGKLLLSGTSIANKWEEFVSTFPTKDGVRRLHNRPSICKEKFKKLEKDTNFDDLMRGLNNEIIIRKQAKEKDQWIENWQLMYTYLHNRSWETYMNLDVEDKEKEILKKRMI